MRETAAERRDLKPIIAFCLYDFGNSAFTTIIVTFVFATYFATGIAADATTG